MRKIMLVCAAVVVACSCASCAVQGTKSEIPAKSGIKIQMPFIGGLGGTPYNLVMMISPLRAGYEWNAGSGSLGIRADLELATVGMVEATIAAESVGIVYYPYSRVEDLGFKPFLTAGGILGQMRFDQDLVLFGGDSVGYIPSTQRNGVEIGAGFVELRNEKTITKLAEHGFYFRTTYRVFGFTLHPDASDGWTGTRHINLSGIYAEWGFFLSF